MKDLKLQAVKVAASFTFSPIILMLIVGLLCITYIIYRKKKDEQNRRLLSVYLQLKPELEQQIRKLRALADRIDNVHRDCTITQVVAKSTSAVSGVLTILGHALAPVTAGVSLGLSATGLGLGAAAAVTSVSTSLVEKISTELAESEASQQVPTSQDKGEVIKKVLEKNTPEFASVFKSSFKKLKDMKTNIDAINLAKSRQAIEKVSLGNTRQVEKSFKGTALAMTKGERIKDATTAGLYLVLDVVSLIQESKHLHEGAKTESAAELRQKAQDLEQRLQELIQVIDSLT
nr:apolipoprotein L3-like [Peromyscus maniculatus bairdii]XP_042120606.1 apolipoprotein L3-like [Peromyscus maniculatus bairdii]XP_042120607.1 apolipoprotein L3-like [Peromyscus maniculatus bairdii]XP_042120608.1 apolipoprotein L3-like [Peromyscus maniculatus bairdii]XP_042120609.1 apolipoprotein L3-like [Peromyscus maniculatus bairdii]XP_042120610.1 apolipoprotein L3-like [Peromyscus maniculatus bairdii]XP_042120611.1 apolipoprotein L3-like [Peromyscus maniculatus bairdii]